MKFAAHVTLAGAPEFRLRTQMAPLSFALNGEGALEIATGTIQAEVAAIPLLMRIPFLSPSRGVAAGSVGPFRIHIKPANATIRAHGVGVEGRIGDGEGGCALEGSARGTVEVDLTGEVPGRLLKAAVEGAFEE
ncbi:MAG: hypothetical protein M0002_14940 [Rhodospirillales bacterium]|nr:hypothetical protein [Rhodospirillales bacterium]